MGRYKKYKDSGVDWIGKMPSHWDVRRIRHLGTARNGLTYSLEDIADDGVMVLRSSNIQNNRLDFNDVVFIQSDIPLSLVLKKDDLLICSRNGSRDLIGKCALIGKEIEGNTYGAFMCVLRGKYNRFIHKVFQSDIFEYYLATFSTATINQLTNSNLYSIKVPFPSEQEQKKLISYLDRRTAEIDELLADLQSQANLLDRYKRELIVDAVTHGIDKTVSHKDSGIDWIGNVPTNWMVVPLRAVAKDNTIKNDEMQCNNLLSLSYGKIIRKDIDTNFGLLPESFEGYQIVQVGYTVLRLTDLQNDKRSLRTGYVSETGIITSAYTGLIPSKQIDGKYFAYLLHAYDLKKIYYGLGGGVRQSLKYSDLKTLPILIPPMSDQRAIVTYINVKTTQVDSLIADINKQIEKLKQYRKIVIHDAVTGKIKVKEMQDNGN